MKSAKMQQVLMDLDIPFDDMMTEPNKFAKRMYNRAMDMVAELDKKSSASEVEEDFKRHSLQNKEAKEAAEAVYNQIMDLIVNQEPEVVANLMLMFPQITQTCDSIVRTMALRKSATPVISKKQLHVLYSKLKECYDAYTLFYRKFDPEAMKGVGMLPAKSGNFGERSGATKLYRIIIDGETWDNPISAGRKLGIEANFYMDVIEAVKRSDGTINNMAVKLEEY